MVRKQIPDLGLLDDEKRNRERLLRPEFLSSFLQGVSTMEIFDLSTYQTGIDQLYRLTKSVHNQEIDRLFLLCIDKLSFLNDAVYWREDLLKSVGRMPQYFKDFAFDIIDIFGFTREEGDVEYLASLLPCEETQALQSAYEASLKPRVECLSLFQGFIERAELTHDDFFDKCAVLSICRYMQACWNDKALITEFRNILELVVEKTQKGHPLISMLVFLFKSNMKKSISRSFYIDNAETLLQKGLLEENVFSNILDDGGARQQKASFYMKYQDFFSLEDKKNMFMKHLADEYFCISAVRSEVPIKTNPILYLHFKPELIDGKLLLFLNIHEAVMYLRKNGFPTPNEFFHVSLANVLSILDNNSLSEATLFPVFLDRSLTRNFIRSLYDVL